MASREGTESTALRDSGINAVGALPWGSHFCHFYETKEDLLGLVVPFMRAGLVQREACLWSVGPTLPKDDAACALRQVVPDLDQRLARRDLEILTHDEWYVENGSFSIGRIVEHCQAKLDEALRRGYAGLRFSGDGAWVEERDRANFREYEKDLSSLIADKRIVILCTYSLAQSRACEVMEVASFHQMALAKRRGDLQILKHQAQTALSESEEKLARANEEFDAVVRERTAELHHALAEIQHFSHTITHDLRSPLRAIHGYSELLIHKVGAQPETAAYVQKITDSVQRMDQLISDALEYSRSARGNLTVETLNPAVLLHDIVASGPEFQAPRADIRIETPLPLVLGSQSGLRSSPTRLNSFPTVRSRWCAFTPRSGAAEFGSGSRIMALE
ncbi:MAG: MEDS domain-containing protein [Candidatus Dormibacteraceae bacterium]